MEGSQSSSKSLEIPKLPPDGALSESIIGGESKGIGILEVGEKPIAAAFLELGIVERSSHEDEGHSRSDVHESDLLLELED